MADRLTQTGLYDRLDAEIARFKVLARESRRATLHCDSCPLQWCGATPTDGWCIRIHLPVANRLVVTRRRDG